MKNIIFCCLLIMTASIFTHSQELLLTRGNIITSIEFNQNHSLYAILDGNMLSLFDEDNQFLSIISRDVTCFSWLTKEFIAVAAGQAVSVYDLKDPQNPVRKHTFNAAGTVSALCGDDERIFVGTKTGDIYLINCKDGASQLFTRTRGEALFLMKKNTLLITISDEDMPRVYDINSGFLEGFLTSESNSPVSAVAKNSESIFMGREDGNIHEYYLSFFSDVNLKPKKTWTLPSPVVALSVSDNKDLVAGLQQNDIAVIDMERQQNNITMRTGFTGGSLTSVSCAKGSTMLIGAGRNLYIDSSGKGMLQVKGTPYTSAELELKYADGYRETKNFSLGTTGFNDWRVPSGDAELKILSQDYLLETPSHLKIEAEPVTVLLKYQPPAKPEKPKEPSTDIIPSPAVFLAGSEQVLVSYHPEASALGFWSGENCILRKLDKPPIFLKHDGGKTAVVYKDQIDVYNVKGRVITTVSLAATPEIVAMKNNNLAAASGQTVQIWNDGKKGPKIEVDFPITALAFSEGGKYILVGNHRSLRNFTAVDGKELPMQTPVSHAIVSLAYSNASPEFPEGRYIAVAYSNNKICICDAVTGKIVRDMPPLKYGIISIKKFAGNVISVQAKKADEKKADEKTAEDQHIFLTVDIQTENILAEIQIGNHAVILPNNIVASASSDGPIELLRNGIAAGTMLTDGKQYFWSLRNNDGSFSFGGTGLSGTGKLPF